MRGVTKINPLQCLKDKYPWPLRRPRLSFDPHGMWYPSNRLLLPDTASVVLEIGSWLGSSTRAWLDRAPNSTVVAVDTWEGSKDHFKTADCYERLPTLYAQFLYNCWEYRDRLIPVRRMSKEALPELAEVGLDPDFIWVDGSHEPEDILFDFTYSREHFPNASICGDDWDWVAAVLMGVVQRTHGHFEVRVAWRYVRENFVDPDTGKRLSFVRFNEQGIRTDNSGRPLNKR